MSGPLRLHNKHMLRCSIYAVALSKKNLSLPPQVQGDEGDESQASRATKKRILKLRAPVHKFVGKFKFDLGIQDLRRLPGHRWDSSSKRL